MRILDLVFSGSVLVTLGVGTAMASQPSDAYRSLSSSNYLEATEATRILFDSGEASIPFLVANLSDTTVFLGLCGNKIRQSQVDFDPDGSSKESGEGTAAETETTVREVSLYLILAILKNDFYFAEACKPEIDDVDNHHALSLASGEIAILFARGQTSACEFSLDAIERVLHRHGVSFGSTFTGQGLHQTP